MKIEELNEAADQTETLLKSDEVLTDSEEKDPVEELQEKGSKGSRIERKCRKAMNKLGLKELTGVSKVTLRKSGNKDGLVLIEHPDVYENKTKSCYVVFGKAKWEVERERRQSEAAERYKAPESGGELESLVVEEEGDMTELGDQELKDTDLIVSQTGVSRAHALAALRAFSGDIVAAVMSLS